MKRLPQIGSWCLISLYFITMHPGKAQERSVVQLDKPYYVAGEVINYQVFLPTAFNKSQPVFEALVYDSQGKLIDRSFLKKEQLNHVHGFYKTPYEIQPGIHQLIINASAENRDAKMQVARAQLPVYGISVASSGATDTINAMGPNAEKRYELDVSLALQNQIGARDQVGFEIKVSDAEMNPVKAVGCISITDIGIIGSSDDHPYRTSYSTPVDSNAGAYLSQHIPVTGNLLNNEEGKLLTFYLPTLYKLQYTTTGANGSFQLLLPEFYGSHDLSYVGQFSDGSKISVSNSQRIDRSSPLIYTHTINNYLQQSHKRRMVYQLFNKTEMTYEYGLPESNRQIQPDKAYNAADYPFMDLPAFCRGISTQLKYVKDKNQGFTFKMFNAENRSFFSGSPLFIVDGQITKDVEYLKQLDFQAFDKVWLFFDDQRLSEDFGFAGYGGVVIIFSKNGNLQVPESNDSQIFAVYGLQPELVPADTGVRDTGEPRFSPQLLWKPGIETNDQGKFVHTFFQSDDISTFQIEVFMQSEDGRRGVGRLEYQVTK